MIYCTLYNKKPSPDDFAKDHGLQLRFCQSESAQDITALACAQGLYVVFDFTDCDEGEE